MPKIKVGIMYDFDKTLCTTDMQNYTFMSDIGLKPEEFWGECGVITKKHEMDKILSYMYLTIKKTKEKGLSPGLSFGLNLRVCLREPVLRGSRNRQLSACLFFPDRCPTCPE